MHIPAAIQNRRGRLAAIVAVGASLALPLSAQAATHSASMTVKDFATKVKGPNGAVIPIREWAWGLDAPVNIGSSSGGAGAGKASFNTFDFKKPIDATSPLFMSALATGHRFNDIVVDVPLTGARKGAATLELHLSTVFVKKDTVSGADGEEPTEDIELAVGAVRETYGVVDDITGDPLATVTASWNQVLNQPVGEEQAPLDPGA